MERQAEIVQPVIDVQPNPNCRGRLFGRIAGVGGFVIIGIGALAGCSDSPGDPAGSGEVGAVEEVRGATMGSEPNNSNQVVYLFDCPPGSEPVVNYSNSTPTSNSPFATAALTCYGGAPGPEAARIGVLSGDEPSGDPNRFDFAVALECGPSKREELDEFSMEPIAGEAGDPLGPNPDARVYARTDCDEAGAVVIVNPDGDLFRVIMVTTGPTDSTPAETVNDPGAWDSLVVGQ